LHHSLASVVSYLDRITIAAGILLEVVKIENLIREVWFHEHIDIKIDITQYSTIEAWWNINVAIVA